MRSGFWFSWAGACLALTVLIGIWFDDRVGTLAYNVMTSLLFVGIPWCVAWGYVNLARERKVAERARRTGLPAHLCGGN